MINPSGARARAFDALRKESSGGHLAVGSTRQVAYRNGVHSGGMDGLGRKGAGFSVLFGIMLVQVLEGALVRSFKPRSPPFFERAPCSCAWLYPWCPCQPGAVPAAPRMVGGPDLSAAGARAAGPAQEERRGAWRDPGLEASRFLLRSP